MRKLTSIRKIKSAALLSLIIPGLVAGFAHESKAEDLSVKATLSAGTTEAGHPVELTLEIAGAINAKVPSKIAVSGLSITHSDGPNVNMQWINGNTSKSVSHTYTINADHPGKFTIPAITVSVNGSNLTTDPVTLTVNGNGGGGGGSGSNSAAEPEAVTNNDIAFAELVVPAQSAYVGEAIPVELRIYFDQRARIGQAGMPDIKCEGFSIQKINQPHQEEIEKNGKHYLLVSFKTAITPVKSGKLTFGPAEMQFVAQIPRQRNPQRRQPGSMDDFFNDDLFNNMMGFSPPQQYAVKSSEINFEIKPLPSAGQPKSFSGAVGQFSLTTDAAPLKLNVGDPITLKLKISGRGNFDRVTAPVVMDEAGWRSYPPSAKFTADDDIGISGVKAFEIAAIPDEKKTKLPEVEFSYFDPVTEKYVTLKGDSLPIAVQGEAPPVVQASPAAGSQPSATPETAKSTNDIHYIMTEPARWGASFIPLFRQRVFWNAQAVPMLAFLAFVGFQTRRRKSQDALAKQLTAWRREQHDLMKILQREDIDHAKFYDAATHYIQIAAARSSRQSPGSIGPAEAIASRPLDAATREGVQSIFSAHGELRYAGTAATQQKLSGFRRGEVLETLRKFEDASE